MARRGGGSAGEDPLAKARRVFREAPFVADIGAELVELAHGLCRSRLTLGRRHLQHGGVVHAGVQATLADHTAGAAASTVLRPGELVLTADFRISLLRAARGVALSCRARVVKPGSRLVFAEADVFCEGGDEPVLVARASLTLAVLQGSAVAVPVAGADDGEGAAAGTGEPGGDLGDGADRTGVHGVDEGDAIRQPDAGREPAHAAAYGVDGCKGGWFFFGLAGADHEFGLAEDFAALMPELAGARRVLVDMPIGLVSAGGRARRCDAQARELLGPRRNSVFPAPSREALACDEYRSACDANARVTGRRISRQAWALAPKIRELDALLAESAAARRVVRESHPELCFYGLAGRPMDHAKRTEAGRAERLAVLRALWAPADEALEHALAHFPASKVAADDVLDAMVLAVTAALPDQRLATLPAPPDRDGEGRWMEMVYPWPEG